MDLVGIIIFLLIGAIAGWLAGQIMKGGSYGLLGDIIVGIVGAAIASFLLPRLGIFIGGNVIGGDHQCHDRCLHIALRHPAGQTLTKR